MSRLLLFFGVCLFVCSCSTSKFDYNTAYKFSYQQQQEQQQEHTVQQQQHTGQQHTGVQTKSESENKELYPPVASLRSLPLSSPARQIEQSSPAITRDSYEKATKTEKKAIRQQVKQEYKSLRQEIKNAKKEAATQDVVFNKKMYIGLVIFAAGLLVAILASGPVGAIGIIVGIGLIAWGFIEQA